MKNYFLILGFLICIIIFSNCKKSIDLSVVEPTPIPTVYSNPYIGKYWQCVTQNASFETREFPILIEYDNKLWMIGGRDIDLKYNKEIWRSDNGVDWNCVTKNMSLTPRILASTVVFKNKMWILCGLNASYFLNDIWCSDNGVDWELITGNANFSPRMMCGLVNYKDTLYLYGGFDGISMKNDLWKSNDGINWSLITNNSVIPPRTGNGFIVFKNQIYIIGGIKNIASGIPSYDNFYDVWRSSDGINWQCIATNANIPEGYNVFMVYNDCIYSFGMAAKDLSFKNDIWKSYDGINWTLVIANPDFHTRVNYGYIVFQNKFFVIGGYKGYGYPLYNDIWYSE